MYSSYDFSHYLSPSKPLFDSLNILKFESLVITNFFANV